MEINWTLKGQDDLERIYRFAHQYSQRHADEVLDRIMSGTADLAVFPRMGSLQNRYEPKEVRKLVLDDYEVHYEIRYNAIYIVDLWHSKENY